MPASEPNGKRGPGRPHRPANMERLAIYVPAELKRWLHHLAIDERKDMGVLVTEALQLLREVRARRHRRKP